MCVRAEGANLTPQVIHVSSGTAGFVAAAIVGPRMEIDRLRDAPHSVISLMLGAGLLWLGWTGASVDRRTG